MTSLLRYIILYMVAVAAMLGATSCGGGGEVATPRRNAYPRLDIPDSVYRPAEGAPLYFEVNADARILPDTASAARRDPRSVWLNVSYPKLGNSVIYTTFTTEPNAKALEDALANRVERMSLNSGGNRSELTEFVTPTGFAAKVLVTPRGTITPVQFLAYDDTHVVSGSYVISETDASRPDSIRPAIEAVARDIIHTLKHLK